MKKIKEADKGYISLDVRINDSEYWLSSISYISATKFVNNKIIDNLYFYIKDSLQNRSELKKSNYIRTFKFAYIELLKFIEDFPIVSHDVNLQKKALKRYCEFNNLTLFENMWTCTAKMLWDAKNLEGSIESCLNELNLKNNLEIYKHLIK